MLAGAQLEDWITNSEDDYLCKARAAARQLSSLRTNRGKWRQQLQQSPLGDPIGLMRALEDAFSAMSKQYTAGVFDSEIQAPV